MNNYIFTKRTKGHLLVVFALVLGFQQMFAQQEICVGETKTYTVDNPGTDPSVLPGANGTVGSTYTWNVTEGTGTIDASIDVSAVTANTVTINWGNSTPGTYTITVFETNSDGCIGEEKVLTVTITAPPNPGTLTAPTNICINQTITVTTDGDAGGTWSVDDTSLATIDPATGELTSIAAGTVTVTYSITGAGGCPDDSATIEITITETPNAGTISGPTEACADENITLTSDGDSGGTWSSSDETIATIDPATGEVTILTSGSVTFTYMVGGTGGCPDDEADHTIVITDAPNAGTLSGDQEICINETTTITTDGDAGGTWSVSDSSIATIDSNGVLTPVTAGTVTVTYTIAGSGGCMDSTAEIEVVISALPITSDIGFD